MRKACARLAMLRAELRLTQGWRPAQPGAAAAAPRHHSTRVSASMDPSPTAPSGQRALAARRHPAGEGRKPFAAHAAVLAQPELSLAVDDGLLTQPPALEGALVMPGGHPYLPEGAPALWAPAPAAAALQAVPNFGYACLNMQLRRQKPACFTNRSCQRKTFDARGLPHVSSLALQNCRDLLPLIEWNHRHGIRLFRLSSALFPWASQYELEQLPDFEAIAAVLAEVGALARRHGQRLTSHPSHFVKLASREEELVAAGLANLELHSRLFDLLGFQPSHWNKINIHVGGVYGNKAKAMTRFARAFDRLSAACRARLTVENDDRPSSYSVADLMALHGMTGIPITFDFHHHRFCEGGQSQEEAFLTAIATWPQGVRPVVHWSESPECPVRSRRHPYGHSAFVYGPILLHGKEADVDVMIESKGGEASLLLYRDELHPAHMLRLAKASQQS